MMYSNINTVMQLMQATEKSFAPNTEATMLTAKATKPATGDCVALMMAGNVITDSVTQGT